MSKLLINEQPLQVLPSLAEEVGLKKAMILQQVHYWLNHSDNHHDGETWVYNTYSQWHEQFPFWSERTVRRVIKNLEDDGLLVSTQPFLDQGQSVKWYRIDYEKLDSLPEDNDSNDDGGGGTDGRGGGTDGRGGGTDGQSRAPHNARTQTENTSENTTLERSSDTGQASPSGDDADASESDWVSQFDDEPATRGDQLPVEQTDDASDALVVQSSGGDSSPRGSDLSPQELADKVEWLQNTDSSGNLRFRLAMVFRDLFCPWMDYDDLTNSDLVSIVTKMSNRLRGERAPDGTPMDGRRARIEFAKAICHVYTENPHLSNRTGKAKKTQKQAAIEVIQERISRKVKDDTDDQPTDEGPVADAVDLDPYGTNSGEGPVEEVVDLDPYDRNGD